MRVFVTDRDESLSAVRRLLMRAWLQSSTREITQEIEAGSGRSIDVRACASRAGTESAGQ
jgi:hypothetical protein